MNRVVLSCVLTLLLFIVLMPSSYADEVSLEISNNGSNSSNEVKIQVNNSTTVTQDNTANVDNAIHQEANSGVNNASSNTTSSSIKTGDVSAATTISNDTINSNTVFVNTPCSCEAKTDISVLENGSSSTNIVNNTENQTITFTQNNSDKITNNVSQTGVSGNNIASNNNGNVEIKTGNVSGKLEIENTNINNTFNNLPTDPRKDTIVTVSSNGESSSNVIVLARNTVWNIFSSNNALVNNSMFQYLTSGGNEANGNNGNVSITTGDVFGSILVKNDHINDSVLVLKDKVCKKDDPGDSSSDDTKPDNSESYDNHDVINEGGAGPHPDNRDNNNSNGDVLGQSLPETGGNLLSIIILTSLILFFAGLSLRLRNNLSPPVA